MIRSVALALALTALVSTSSFAAGGSFSGASGHKTSGSVTVTEKNGRLTIRLESNFRLDGAPDPYVTLGNSSRPTRGGTAGVIRKHTGSGTYSVKATAATRAAKQVVIWCKKYGVPLGVARLK